jgi:TatA/E family protein of Tat protein translocase
MMFRNFGIPELILVLVLALLVFGPGRIAKLGSELGKGIRGFKDQMQSGNQEATKEEKATEEA